MISLRVALRALTLEPARILGVERDRGSIEEGKSASLFVVDGDPLEIRSRIETVFIDGRETDPRENRHHRLYERYAGRPGP
jgi:imidazolonepropionase-like amidohydrolase